jgi:hypothetical protein
VCFHTSCSVDLMTGDIYGPLTVLGGGSCPVQVQDPCGPFGCCPLASESTTPKINDGGSNCYQDPCGTYVPVWNHLCDTCTFQCSNSREHDKQRTVSLTLLSSVANPPRPRKPHLNLAPTINLNSI